MDDLWPNLYQAREVPKRLPKFPSHEGQEEVKDFSFGVLK